MKKSFIGRSFVVSFIGDSMEQYLEHIFDNVDETIHLDEEQKKVVVTDGDLLVIAGAGSGKTTTMVAKVKYLIEIKKIKPEQILLISYTNKATEELKTRIQQDLGLKVAIKTFHKLGLELLKQHQEVFIETNTKTALKGIIEKMKKDKKWKWKLYIFARKYREKKDYSKLVYLCETFMKNYKMKGKPDLKTLNLPFFWTSFLTLVINEYDTIMKKEHKIDFEDMILESIKLIDHISFPYKYVIVDEYQDISKDRFLLLQALKKKFQICLIVVGDDWQSIFGFSGSEISLFTQFQTFFPYAQQLKITNTYRNSQELIDLAGKFVMKNHTQIEKKLISFKRLKDPVVLCPYRNSCLAILKKILQYISTLRDFSTIFLLGRYHKDFQIEKFPFLTYQNDSIFCSLFPNLTIYFLTVHSAKGLGADEVILLNGDDKVYGFPTNKKTDPILKNVQSVDSSYPYAEERRLFYVALTRTKNHVFILYTKPSIFVKEIKDEVCYLK